MEVKHPKKKGNPEKSYRGSKALRRKIEAGEQPYGSVGKSAVEAWGR